MNIAKTLTGLSMLTLVATPVIAQAAQVDAVRIAAPVKDSEGAIGSTGIIIALGFVAAMAALVIIASDDGEPTSP